MNNSLQNVIQFTLTNLFHLVGIPVMLFNSRYYCIKDIKFKAIRSISTICNDDFNFIRLTRVIINGERAPHSPFYVLDNLPIIINNHPLVREKLIIDLMSWAKPIVIVPNCSILYFDISTAS